MIAAENLRPVVFRAYLGAWVLPAPEERSKDLRETKGL